MAQKIKRRIRVLFTIPNFDTAGSGKALLKVATGLNSKLFDAQICCMHSRGAFFKEVESSGLPIHILDYTTKMKPYLKGIIRCYRVSRLFKKINPDIIHSFHYAPDYSEGLAAKFARVKWIYTKKNMNWGGSSKNGWKMRTFLSSVVIAQNTDMIKKFFVGIKKVHLISRGVDTKEFVYKKPSNTVKKQWDISESDRVIICVANLVPIKGVEVLINAFSIIDNSNWKLLLVGDANNAYGQGLKDLTSKLKLNTKIIFTGKQANISDYLSIAELFVLPTLSKGEGSPVALLEAMACEKNVLGSKIPGIKDQLELFSNHLFEPGNAKSLAEAMRKVCANSTEENKALGKAFRKHVLENYQISHEIVKCEQLYLDILN